MRSKRLLLPLLLPFAFAGAAPPAHAQAPAWERADESIQCTDKEGSAPFYNGPSASKVYDRKFALAHAVPKAMLDNFVPQGLGTWRNWGGKGKNLLVQSGYNDGAGRSAIVGMVPGGGATQIATLLDKNGNPVKAHVGGVAFAGKWMWVSGPQAGGYATVLRYGLPATANKLRSGGGLKAQQQFTLPVPSGFAASFIAPQGRSLWIGTFDENHRNRMHRFGVTRSGALKWLTGAGGWVQIPKKAQGLAVTKTHFVSSTSWGRDKRSNIYVIRRGHRFLDDAYPGDLRCFTAPSMSEGITFSGGKAFLSFESGSFAYRGDSRTRNVITRLHQAPAKALTGMT